ncbi:unnamed protein product [Rotaria magnacalcarata]|uniref:Uncharacterized protein n=1 Tax=Rotaria magnacalcarata TaxID=392030 RepID=A0A816RW87_9BILA|nr:unnamed protein product [Rotaria magnacalcarata]CAF3860508.1 unnamed protein product [Rotaria magnacalcarata]
MDNKESTVNTIRKTTATVRSTSVLPRYIRRVIKNFLLVWLDANLDESKQDFKNSLTNLQQLVVSIRTFTDAEQCIRFIKDTKEEKIVLIISGSLGQTVIPNICACSQLDSIYVFCSNQSVHEQWTKDVLKVKGVHTSIESICNALQVESARCDRDLASISCHGIDSLFMYAHLLKEALLEINDNDTKHIKELSDYCRLQDNISNDELDKIATDYYRFTPIWWYTAPYFFYSMLNRGLRLFDINIIVKMGFFIRHLHQDIEQLYREQRSTATTTPFEVYRGQGLSLKDLNKMKRSKGGLMAFNNFLSTSRNRNIALSGFARPAALVSAKSVGILFAMTIDPTLCKSSATPYADVRKVGFYHGQEEEILFSIYTIFRIDKIERIDSEHRNRLWQVKLTLVSNDDAHLNKLTAHTREELIGTRGWSRVGNILIRMEQSTKAEQLFQLILANISTTDEDQANYNYQLGCMYTVMKTYSKAISSYEQALKIYETKLPAAHPLLATCCNNIGTDYKSIGEYSKALSFYQRAVDINKEALASNHLSWTTSSTMTSCSLLATSYNNIGGLYYMSGNYAQALLFYKRALTMKENTLPPNHPSFATCYNNIGLVFDSMGKYSKALSFYQQALDVDRKNLPATRELIVEVKRNIKLVKKKM